MYDLDELRKEIDEIDRKIVSLIEMRTEVSKKVGEYKKSKGLPVLDAAREEIVIKKRKEMLSNKELSSDIEEIYTLIMKLSREKQV